MAKIAQELRIFVAWICRVGSWAFDPKPLWLAVGVVVAAWVVAVAFGPTEPVIRLTGLVLQILGIGTVIWGIEQTRRLFHHPTMLQSFAGWLKRFPPYKRSEVVSVSGVSSVTFLGKLGTKVWNHPPANATLDQRVATVEANVGHLDKRVDQTLKELEQLETKQTGAIDRERSERAAEDAKINEKIEAGHTGGLHISAIGAVWLFFGIIMSTAAPELAQWLK